MKMTSKKNIKDKLKKGLEFQAVNDYILIEPIEETKEDKAFVVAKRKDEKSAFGKVISVGEGRYLSDNTKAKPQVEVGDTILYDPNMLSHEVRHDDGSISLIINSLAVYGKFK